MPKVIGPGFEGWVQTQIKTRQEKNKISSNKGEGILKYQNANDSFIRLTSAIDVQTSNADATNFQLFSTRFSGVGANGQFSSGVGIGTNLNTAYGAFSSDSYGYVPPPGIVSAEVKSLNRGSFREANIKILTHSSTQFEIIEQIYLKLGYSMLLEWGHNTYFDNKGVYLPNNTHESYTVFLNKNSSQLDVQTQMQRQRIASFGNYDAMHGSVSNYSWNIEKDGSYNINLVISSVGEIIESMKGNVSHPTSIASTTDVPVDQPPLQYNSEKSTLNKILYWFTTKLLPKDLLTKYALNGSETTTSLINAGVGLSSNKNNNSDPTAQDVVGFIFPELLGIQDGTIKGYNGQYFIKLGVLLRCIQNYILLYNSSKSNEPLININTNEEDNFCFTYPRQGSLDPRVCLIDVIKDLTNTIPTSNTNTTPPPPPPPSGYAINNTYYDFREIELTYLGGVVQYKEYYDPEIGWPTNAPTNINSYDPTIYSKLGPDDEKKFNQFLQDNLGSLKGIVEKTGPIIAGSVTTLDNFPVRSNSTFGIGLLDKYSIQNKNFSDFTKDFIEKWSDYQTIEYKTPAIENTPYLTNVWTPLNEKKITSNYTDSNGDSWNYELKITTYRITVSTLINSNIGYTGANTAATADKAVDVQNNLFDKIRDGSNFRVDNYPFIGRIMNIYINMNHAAKILQDYVDISNGSISLFSFLENMMKGVQHALGNINNFSIHYDENANEFSIIDNTMIPQLGDYLKHSTTVNPFDNKPVVFQTHALTSTNGSFIREAKVTSKISNNLMSQVTIGAQDNGNVVGSNSLAFSKWNKGLTDRIILEKSTENNGQGSTQSDIDQKFFSNVGIVQNLYNAINDGNITDQQIDGSIDAGVDLFNYEIGMYANEGLIPGVGLIPIDVELTMDGLSGMRIMDSYEADTKLLPKNYQKNLQFITMGISHKIQDNDWTTTIQSVSGPRYDGTTVTAPSTPKSHPVASKKQTIWKPSPPTDNSNPGGTDSANRGDLFSWAKGPGGKRDDNWSANSYVVAVLKGKVRENFVRKATNPLKLDRSYWDTNKKGVRVFIEKYKTVEYTQAEQDKMFKDVLTKLGAPSTAGNIIFLKAWRKAEGADALNNPFNSTQRLGTQSNFNTVPVQNYFVYDDGITATFKTMTNGHYDNIVKALKVGLADQAEALELAKLVQLYDMSGLIPAKWQ